MAKDQITTIFRFHYFCCIIAVLSAFSFISIFFWCHFSSNCYSINQIMMQNPKEDIDLLTFPSAWNHLSFPSDPPPKLLKIALFVKKWPHKSHAGGLERHALTLHLALAKRGHELHIFTASSPNSSFPRYPISNLIFHLSKPTGAGYLEQAVVWKQFQTQNSTRIPFDVIHTESVGLLHTRAKNLTNLAVTWHGIAYETIHSDIIQELLWTPEEQQAYVLTERAKKVVEEVRFFPRYSHHVATSDHAGDVLKRIYMIPEERVHIILNGVDEEIFKPDFSQGNDFKGKFGISKSRSLILGMAGRLVKDKGHPLIFEALKQIFMENEKFRETVIVLVAGDGPWGARYRDLGANIFVLGPLEQAQLAKFYNAIDIFMNPTLRAQGLDHTLLEAILTGKPVIATRLASITGSVIVGPEMGYTFSPTVASLKKALYRVWNDGREVLEKKGKVARQRGLQLFTATKMAAAYERLFLCILKEEYCKYQNPFN
ncbi:UDP-Glycosyltransferase superfamily protein [Theobroma cacao]|uniref:UDP-Glycosyltransferase superfamily protein n=1 Tax=Theobroma cacao TaxID=3641 RepID=A0A061GXH6_THECC|nr:UDP-Glycosyltransferase superfamily protein [Theobroma cacao]